MADEIESPATTAESPGADIAATPLVKKPRKPRSPKASAVIAELMPNEVKSGRGRRKAAEVGETKRRPGRPGKAAAIPRGAAKELSVSQGGEAEKVAPAAIDGIAELRELEAENQRLRAALSAKLRAENADLRKRLGLD